MTALSLIRDLALGRAVRRFRCVDLFGAEIVTARDLETALGDFDAWTPQRTRIVGAQANDEAAYQEMLFRQGFRLLTVGGIHRLLEKGNTVVFGYIDRAAGALRGAVRLIEEAIGGHADASLFISRAGASTFPPHSDEYHIFACQVVGSRTWHIIQGPGPNCCREMPMGVSPTDPSWDYSSSVVETHKLQEGEVLYVPPNTMHRVEASVPNACVSIAVHRFTRYDVMRFLLMYLDQERCPESLRQEISSADDVEHAIADLVSSIVEMSKEDRFQQAMRSIMKAQVPDRSEVSLGRLLGVQT